MRRVMAVSGAAFKAHIGWVNAVVDVGGPAGPRPSWAGRIDLFGESPPREVIEPFHVAGGWRDGKRGKQPADPAAVIEAARRRQDELAKRTLQTWWERSDQPEVAVLLIRRGVVHDLERTLADQAHVRIAECDAVRDAVYEALAALGLDPILQDEKLVPAMTAERLGCAPEACDAYVKPLKPAGARRWSKEERTIALAAWLHAYVDLDPG